MRVILPIIFLLNSFFGFSQEKKIKYSFYAGGGLFSARYLDTYATHLEPESSRGHLCPVLNTGIQIEKGKWRVGSGFSYDHFGPKDRSAEYSTLSYYLAADRSWIESRDTKIYSGFSLGVSVFKKLEKQTVIEKKVEHCFDVVVFGTEFCLGNISVDVGLGYGVAGLVKGALRYSFP